MDDVVKEFFHLLNPAIAILLSGIVALLLVAKMCFDLHRNWRDIDRQPKLDATAKERLERLKLRYEIEAIKKSNQLTTVPGDDVSYDRLTVEAPKTSFIKSLYTVDLQSLETAELNKYRRTSWVKVYFYGFCVWILSSFALAGLLTSPRVLIAIGGYLWKRGFIISFGDALSILLLLVIFVFFPLVATIFALGFYRMFRTISEVKKIS